MFPPCKAKREYAMPKRLQRVFDLEPVCFVKHFLPARMRIPFGGTRILVAGLLRRFDI